MENSAYIVTPVGPVEILERDGAIVEISFLSGSRPHPEGAGKSSSMNEVARQIAEYFAGERKIFDLPLCPAGTEFQKSVWTALRSIPYGETRTYGQIARAIGKPRACRAVGMAIHRNPVAIIIPCHRVIGSDGGLTGYAAGLDIKRALLKLEKQHS